MDKHIKLITLANVGGIIFGIYSIIEGLMKPNPYHFPVAEFVVGPALLIVCGMWIGLSFWIFGNDKQKLEIVQ